MSVHEEAVALQLPSFQELVRMYREDPEAFAAFRQRVLTEAVSRAHDPQRAQWVLRGVETRTAHVRGAEAQAAVALAEALRCLRMLQGPLARLDEIFRQV